ncbi:MAG: hypothetical protein HYX61_09040 [Gammaproteobacteria bacterium]|jgi:Ulp1 family protease|nr:hypothetical protein [Gammaproteobacteria bacterium]
MIGNDKRDKPINFAEKLAKRLFSTIFSPYMSKQEETDDSKEEICLIELDSSDAEEIPLKRSPAKRKKQKPPVSPNIIDLTEIAEVIEIDSDDEKPSSKKVKTPPKKSPLEFIMIPEATPEELAESQALLIEKNTMLLQYKQQLGIEDTVKASASMKQIKKNVFALQSKVYEKYSSEGEKETLETLISMIEHLDEKQASDLLNDEWLNDEIINKYLTILANQNNHIAVLPTGYAVDPKDFFNNLKMNKNCVKETRNTLTKAQRILWPMGDGSHWYLVVIDKLPNGKFNLFCLDSLNSDNEEYLEKAKSLLQSLYPDQVIDDLIHKQEFIQVPTQNNWVDCGVAVCYYAKLCANKLLPRNKAGLCDYSQFRFNIAEEFAKNVAVEPTEATDASSPKKRYVKSM